MGRGSRGTYGRPFGCLGDTNKEKTMVFNIPLNKKPILTKGGNRIIYLLFSFPLIPPDNQAALPSNKWLRVSKQPWPLGRRFAVQPPFRSGRSTAPELEATIRSDWIWSYPTQPRNLERPACLDGRTGRGGVVPILYPGTSRNIQKNGKANTCT